MPATFRQSGGRHCAMYEAEISPESISRFRKESGGRTAGGLEVNARLGSSRCSCQRPENSQRTAAGRSWGDPGERERKENGRKEDEPKLRIFFSAACFLAVLDRIDPRAEMSSLSFNFCGEENKAAGEGKTKNGKKERKR